MQPIVFFYKGRPFTGGLCAGVEEAMATMKAGGKRLIKAGVSKQAALHHDLLAGKC
jgi:hypothetical protein